MPRDLRRDVAVIATGGSQAHLDEWVAHETADENGLLQAGKLLEWMEVVGRLCATRHCRQPVVAVAVEGMELRQPLGIGERVALTAQVAYTSPHSIGVTVTMPGGLESWMTFVPLDRRGRPMMVPPFMPTSSDERERFREGELRRDFRRQLESGHLDLRPVEAEETLGEVSRSHWPLAVQQWMSRLPRYLRMPWERGRPLDRQRSYLHRIEPVSEVSLDGPGGLNAGTLMRWAEISAALSARAWAGGRPMRCAGVHGLCFLRPVQRHRFVHLRSVVVHSTPRVSTSLVSVQAEDPTSGEESDNLRAFFTYTPLSESARLPPVTCRTPEERGLFEEVEHRLALQRRL
jgi:acyl-CoA hydrolase